MTVRGPVPPDALGVTMAHEHVFFDLSAYWDPSGLEDPALGEAPFEARMGGLARWDAAAFRDNLLFSPERDYELVREELRDFAEATGASGCVVDLTTTGLHPDHEQLARLAADLDLHVVAGCGIYVHATHPRWVEEATVEELTARLLRDAREGMGPSGVRPGIIGEIGTSERLEPCEERVLRAAARVAMATGLAVNVHCHPPALEVVQRILDVLADEGHDLTRTYLSHLDELWDLDYHEAVLRRGVVMGFDSYGQDGYFSPTWKSLSDLTKMQTMVALVERGYADQLVMAQDVCKKHHLQRFGGFGYGHVVRRIVPRLRDVFGLDDEALDRLLVTTPRRLLTLD